MYYTPEPNAPIFCDSPVQAFETVRSLYQTHTKYLRNNFQNFIVGQKFGARIRAFYPYARITTKHARPVDSRLSYGFAPLPGTYSNTLTRPDVFRHYYLDQFTHIVRNHDIPIEVGVSNIPIPIHFAFNDMVHLEGDLVVEQLQDLAAIFDVPNLDVMDDAIANAAYVAEHGSDEPLSLFTAPRVDLSLHRLKHYCGTSAENFQNYVIFTNYQFYIDEFIKFGSAKANSEGYGEFIEPEGLRSPQMPAYHLQRKGNAGITMVNIGVGPSNAKTITDHIAVLRPHVWLMLGHCAGLRNSQNLGDYVLAHGYLRDDHILDEDLPPSIPIPALAEVQKALEKSVGEICGFDGYDVKKVMRTGTVATTDDRNWELHPTLRQKKRLSQSRAIAMDMESGTIAANGFRFRVPYGALLCVSDKPLHGNLKLPGMADSFYRLRVAQHLRAGVRAMEMLRELEPEKLHSRKLRCFNEVTFQ